MSYKQLSDRLRTRANWPISSVGIRRLEKGERRVTPDDLTALSFALGISPATLLMPGLPKDDGRPDEAVQLTGMSGKTDAGALWKWLQADPSGHVVAEVPPGVFMADAQPPWEQTRWLITKDDDGG